MAHWPPLRSPARCPPWQAMLPPPRGSSHITLVRVMLMTCVVRRRAERVFRPDSKDTSAADPRLFSARDRVRVGMGVK